MRKSLVILVLVLSSLFLVMGILQAEEGELVFGYAAPYLTDEGQTAIQQGVLNYAEKLGIKVITTNAGQDVAKQISQIDDLITMGVDAIIFVPQDSAALSEAVKSCNEAGIPVFTIDRGVESGEVEFTVMSDNYMAGQQAGEYMVKLLKEKYGKPKGTVLELQGDLAHDVAHLRGGGFNDIIKKYPNIEVISKPTQWDPQKGANITQDVLQSKKIDGIFWHSDFTGSGVVPAVEATGKMKPVGDKDHIFLVGIDGAPSMLDYIRAEKVDGTVNQPLLDFGVIVEIAKDIVEGKSYSPGLYKKEGALWSPATIKEGKNGLVLNLATNLVNIENVNDKRFWGNINK